MIPTWSALSLLQSPQQQAALGEELARSGGSGEVLAASGGSGGFGGGGGADPMQRRPLAYWSPEEKAAFLEAFQVHPKTRSCAFSIWFFGVSLHSQLFVCQFVAMVRCSQCALARHEVRR